MNFDAMITRGRLPWSPNEHAQNLDVWHALEVPYAGTFDFDGETVLFTAIGELDSTMLTATWAYTCVGHDVPDAFASFDDMDDWIHTRFDGSEAVYAHTQDLRIKEYSGCEKVSSLEDGVVNFLENLLKTLERKHPSPRVVVAARQAAVEEAERDLAGV
jgi:hypothetical protein